MKPFLAFLVRRNCYCDRRWEWKQQEGRMYWSDSRREPRPSEAE